MRLAGARGGACAALAPKLTRLFVTRAATARSLPVLYVLSAICCEAHEKFGANNLYGAWRGERRCAQSHARARLSQP